MIFKSKNDDGAALAMVLIFIVVVGLWMASLAVLMQTSNASLTKNSDEKLRRAQLVNSVLPQVINSLTTPTSRQGLDMRETPCFYDNSSPDESSKPLPAATLGPYTINTVTKTGSTQSDTVMVKWAAACKSGSILPVASFLLTGGQTANGTIGVTGKDGGLNLPSNMSIPLKITGGITNVSGAWIGVSATNLELSKICSNPQATICESDPAPQIIQPSDPSCPALVYDVARCNCPAYTASNFTSNNICPIGVSGSTYASLNPLSDVTELKGYLDSISSALEAVRNTNSAVIPTCRDTPVALTSGGRTIWVLQVMPGYINDAGYIRLNSLLSGSGCGSGDSQSSPAVQFTKGIYRFGWCDSLITYSACKLNINTQNLKVFGGTPKWAATEPHTSGSAVLGELGWECDTTTSGDGVQFQFQNYTFLDLGQGSVSLCPLAPNKPIFAAPIDTPTNPAPFSWKGASYTGNTNTPIFIMSTGGCGSGCQSFYSHGQIFTPAGWISLRFNGDSYGAFSKGVVAKAVTITSTGSTKSTGSVAPPGSFNGDRVIQVHFWITESNGVTRSQDLGIVQVVIRDYFGRRWGAGYKVISWRTLW